MSPVQFIVVALQATADSDGALGRFRGLQDGLQSATGLGWALLIIGFAGLVIVALVIQMLMRGIRRRRRLVENWREFGARMDRWELDAPSRALLRELARRECPQTPVTLLEQIEVFERAVHRYLKPICAAGGQRAEKAARAVAEARRKLGFVGTEGPVYYSTRELRQGQQLQLAPRGGSEFWGTVAEQSEASLHVKPSAPLPADVAGQTVEVVFFEGNRAYSFEARVLRLDASASECVLEHVLDVRSAGAREFHRVDVGKSIAFRAAWEDEDVERIGVLRDLSAGGLALVSQCYYEDGEDVVVSFRPADYLSHKDEAGPELEERRITGTIVETERVAGGRCLYHVNFPELDAEGRRYLFRLVHRLELAARE